jgi:hypothetical protein
LSDRCGGRRTSWYSDACEGRDMGLARLGWLEDGARPQSPFAGVRISR